MTQLRPIGRACVTMSSYLRAIGRGLDHFERAGIQIEQRMATGAYFSTQELQFFATYCKRSDRKLYVSRDQASHRYHSFLAYVYWRATTFIGRSSSDAILIRAQNALDRFKKRAAAVAPPPDKSLPSPDVREGLTPSQRELLLSVVQPDYERNPWGNPALRYRNYAMVMLVYELGPRAGDVLSVKIRDLNLAHSPATVTFHRRHDDPEDPRTDQPVLKTKPRVLQISDQLALILEHWIDKIRADRRVFPNARKHPFLFVNCHGDPLGKRGYQLVFSSLRKKFPELGNLVSHVLRHDWNERWTDMTSNDGGDNANAVREQCYAMGWADRSAMPVRYSKRAIADSANRKIARMHALSELRGKKLQSDEKKA